MKYLAHLSIRFYQKFISPYKGFRCAHAALHGGDSCSEAVRKIVLSHGVIKGINLVRQQFKDCKIAYLTIQSQENKKDEKDKDNGKNKKRPKKNRDDGCIEGAVESVCDLGCNLTL